MVMLLSVKNGRIPDVALTFEEDGPGLGGEV